MNKVYSYNTFFYLNNKYQTTNRQMSKIIVILILLQSNRCNAFTLPKIQGLRINFLTLKLEEYQSHSSFKQGLGEGLSSWYDVVPWDPKLQGDWHIGGGEMADLRHVGMLFTQGLWDFSGAWWNCNSLKKSNTIWMLAFSKQFVLIWTFISWMFIKFAFHSYLGINKWFN